MGEFEWEFDLQRLSDFSSQSLKILENSLLAEVFGTDESMETCNHNHIESEHDYFKKKFSDNTDMIGQNNCLSVEKTRYKAEDCKTKLFTEKTYLKEKYVKDDYFSQLSKPEQKSMKKFQRKMKNRVSAQESRKKKKEYLQSLENNYKILVEETDSLKKIFYKMEREHQELNKNIDELKCRFNISKCLFEC